MGVSRSARSLGTPGVFSPHGFAYSCRVRVPWTAGGRGLAAPRSGHGGGTAVAICKRQVSAFPAGADHSASARDSLKADFSCDAWQYNLGGLIAQAKACGSVRPLSRRSASRLRGVVVDASALRGGAVHDPVV